MADLLLDWTLLTLPTLPKIIIIRPGHPAGGALLGYRIVREVESVESAKSDDRYIDRMGCCLWISQIGGRVEVKSGKVGLSAQERLESEP